MMVAVFHSQILGTRYCVCWVAGRDLRSACYVEVVFYSPGHTGSSSLEWVQWELISNRRPEGTANY